MNFCFDCCQVEWIDNGPGLDLVTSRHSLTRYLQDVFFGLKAEAVCRRFGVTISTMPDCEFALEQGLHIVVTLPDHDCASIACDIINVCKQALAFRP